MSTHLRKVLKASRSTVPLIVINVKQLNNFFHRLVYCITAQSKN